jgi:uroporphyrin-III C-methyltransferase
MTTRHNTVFIVGAGPGDPELLTVKAYRLLKRADVVLYDRLVHREILSYVPSGCECIYVGKHDGKHLVPQEAINGLLLEHACRPAPRTILRLKGGDPFLFGRGGEEALFLSGHGVPFEIVPGVTSALSVPAYAGIPVTHRGVASLCTIVTGHLAAKHPESITWASFRNNGTLLFLMSVAVRKEIASQLMAHGRPAEQPVAFVERGTTARQKVWTTTLAGVLTEPLEVRAPAIMIVGDVVNLRKQLDWFSNEQLGSGEFQGIFPVSSALSSELETASDS